MEEKVQTCYRVLFKLEGPPLDSQTGPHTHCLIDHAAHNVQGLASAGINGEDLALCPFYNILAGWTSCNYTQNTG